MSRLVPEEALEAFGSLDEAGAGDYEHIVIQGEDALLADSAKVGELGPDGQNIFPVFVLGLVGVDGVAHFKDHVRIAGEELFDGDLGVHGGRIGEDVVGAGGLEEGFDVGVGPDGDHAFEALGSAADEKDGAAALGDGGADLGEALFEGLAEFGGLGLAVGEGADAVDGGEDGREGFEVHFFDAEVEGFQAGFEADGVFDDEDEGGFEGGDGFEIGLEEGADLGFGESGGGVAAVVADALDLGAEIESEEDLGEAGDGGDVAWRGLGVAEDGREDDQEQEGQASHERSRRNRMLA